MSNTERRILFAIVANKKIGAILQDGGFLEDSYLVSVT
jgi:hypothetical protein